MIIISAHERSSSQKELTMPRTFIILKSEYPRSSNSSNYEDFKNDPKASPVEVNGAMLTFERRKHASEMIDVLRNHPMNPYHFWVVEM